MKVCVYAICKNEEVFVDRWMDSMSEADMVVVTDTGSTDDTTARLWARGAVVFEERIHPWRFDTARNISLSHVPEDTDICVCTDLDELFDAGWRKSLEEAWLPGTTMARYLYNWSLKPDGTPDIQFNYFKAHAPRSYSWTQPVHEFLSYTGSTPEKTVFVPGMVLNHYPDGTKSRSSYLPLLELAAAEAPDDDRAVYYLGREYMYKGEWQMCIDTLKKHLTLPSALWREERCSSMRWIAKSYIELANIREAEKWYFRAIAECPHMREPYIECAKMYYTQADWEAVYSMVEEALKITDKSDCYINMGYCWDYTPYDLGAIACYWLGMMEKSVGFAKKALEMEPNDPRLLNNLEIIESRANL